MTPPSASSVSDATVRIPSDHWLARLPWALLIGGVVLLGLAALVGRGHEGSFAFAYLLAFTYWLSIALGGLFFVLWNFATRSGWSVVVRRVAEAAMGTLPFFALLFVPLAFFIHDLYHWSHAEAVASDPLLLHKEPYLNSGFFVGRAVVYLAIWGALAIYFRSRSLDQDETGNPAITRQLQAVAPVGIILFGLSITAAAFDWLMSLDPHWYSTIFGVYYFAGCLVGIMAFLAITTLALKRTGFLAPSFSVEHQHDIGKLLFAFTCFWAYIAFSQFMLMWYANIPEETAWYHHRWDHGWSGVSMLLLLGHFAVPFALIMSRHVKRSGLGLAALALWMLALHAVDLFWLIMPAAHGEGPHVGLVDVLALLGLGGVFLGLFGRLLVPHALLPVRDPRLPESLSFENF